MKRQPEYRFDPERHARKAVEQKCESSAALQTAITSPETGGRTVFLFELGAPSRMKVYAWIEAKKKTPWIPKVIIVPATSEVNSEAAAIEFHEKRPET